MVEQHHTLDKVLSGKAQEIKLNFILTSIGTKEDPMYDCYIFQIKMPGMKEFEDKEYLELKPKDKGKTYGDVTWVIKNVEGDEEDPSDPDGDRRITTYKMSEVVFKTYEDEDKSTMAKAIVTFPFEAVLATENWEE